MKKQMESEQSKTSRDGLREVEAWSMRFLLSASVLFEDLQRTNFERLELHPCSLHNSA